MFVGQLVLHAETSLWVLVLVCFLNKVILLYKVLKLIRDHPEKRSVLGLLDYWGLHVFAYFAEKGIEGDAEGIICEKVKLCLVIHSVAAAGHQARLQVRIIGTFHLKSFIG